MEQMQLPGMGEGDEMAAKAAEWVRRNPDAWRWMCYAAHEHAARGERFSIGDLAESVRWRRSARGVDDFKVNNTLRAPLARMLVRAVPQCREFIVMRKSKCDGCGR